MLDRGPLRAPTGRLHTRAGRQPGRTWVVNPAAPAGPGPPPGQRPLARHSVTQLSHHWHDHLNSVITGIVSEPGASRRPAGARAAATGPAFTE